MKSIYSFVGASMVFAAFASAQVLNGSFENNSGFVLTNASNATYNANVSDSVQFGTAEETDLWDSSGFGMITPWAGNWMVGMHNQGNGNADSISLALASPLVVNQTYTLYFAAALYNAGWGGTFDIGTSSSANSFGNYLVSATPGSDSTWTLFGYSFTATSADSYLTFTVANGGGYAFLDAVSLTPTPGAAAVFGLAGLAAARRRRA
ncbi:MAG: hypothetical protein QM783_03440 [Phycisphaerales bacterium]